MSEQKITAEYIDRCVTVMREMLAERDEDGAPVWVRPQPWERTDYANRFHDEMCYRLRMSGDGATQMRMPQQKRE